MKRVGIQGRSLVAMGMVALLSGCATIMGGGSSQAVRVEATPAGATFAVKSSSGLQMATGTAPESIRLPRKNEYQIDFTVPGYQPQSAVLTRGSNGWIWGNLLVGWIVGFVVDFATGSAYKLEPALVQIHRAPPHPYGVTPNLEQVVKDLKPGQSSRSLLRCAEFGMTPVWGRTGCPGVMSDWTGLTGWERHDPAPIILSSCSSRQKRVVALPAESFMVPEQSASSA